MGRYDGAKEAADALGYPLVAVCIDKDKNSPNALRWAIDTLVGKGQTIVLVHVNTKGASGGVEDAAGFKQPTDPHLRDLFIPFRCFCTRKGIQCKDVVLDDHEVAKSIIEFSAHGAIEKLVVGACTRGGLVRFKADIPTTISKGAPAFCTVYVINKGNKVSSVRSSTGQAPRVSPLRSEIQSLGAAVNPPGPSPAEPMCACNFMPYYAIFEQNQQLRRANETLTRRQEVHTRMILMLFAELGKEPPTELLHVQSHAKTL